MQAKLRLEILIYCNYYLPVQATENNYKRINMIERRQLGGVL